MTSLANYETTFGVRQVDSYTFPGASVGLTSGFEGSLDGMPRDGHRRRARGPVLVPQRAIAHRQLRPERLRIVWLPRDTGTGGGPDVHAARRRPDPRRDHAWITGRRVQRRLAPAARADVPRERRTRRTSKRWRTASSRGRPTACTWATAATTSRSSSTTCSVTTASGAPRAIARRAKTARSARRSRRPTSGWFPPTSRPRRPGKPRTTSGSRSHSTVRRATASPVRPPVEPANTPGSSTTR